MVPDNRQRRQVAWSRTWANPGYKPPWLGRGTSPELVWAVTRGHCHPPGKVLDIGCGEGRVAAWFAGQGFTAVGVDFARPAIRRARKGHAGTPNLLYEVVDVVRSPVPFAPYDVLVDRGCFHGLPPRDHAHYVENISRAAAGAAYFFLYIRAFRGSYDGTEADEQKHLVAMIRRLFIGTFTIVRWKRTDIGAGWEQNSSKPLPGLFFLMRRR